MRCRLRSVIIVCRSRFVLGRLGLCKGWLGWIRFRAGLGLIVIPLQEVRLLNQHQLHGLDCKRVKQKCANANKQKRRERIYDTSLVSDARDDHPLHQPPFPFSLPALIIVVYQVTP